MFNVEFDRNDKQMKLKSCWETLVIRNLRDWCPSLPFLPEGTWISVRQTYTCKNISSHCTSYPGGNKTGYYHYYLDIRKILKVVNFFQMLRSSWDAPSPEHLCLEENLNLYHVTEADRLSWLRTQYHQDPDLLLTVTYLLVMRLWTLRLTPRYHFL